MTTTYYAEATITATGTLMADAGLTADQIAHLRAAESRGTISGLIVSEDIDLSAAFSR